MSAEGPRFELLRLAAEEVAEGVAVVELEGRWDGDAPDADDALLLAGDARVAPVAGSAAVRDGVLRATFAVPAAAASGPLVLAADGVRVRLPGADGLRADRLAALARELNDVRHERDALRDEMETLRAEREREAAAARPAAPVRPAVRRAPPPAPTVVPERPPGLYFALAALGVVGFLLLVVLLL